MTLPRTVLVSVLALAVVAAAGWAGYHRSRSAAVMNADATIRIDGTVHDCGPHHGVYVDMSGPVGARFVVDGVEVPAERREAYAGSPERSTALLPESLAASDCAGEVAHRVAVLTADTGSCSWSVRSQQTQEEALGHQQALDASGHGCVLTLG